MSNFHQYFLYIDFLYKITIYLITNIFRRSPMLNEIKRGSLAPCPVCGGSDIRWYRYRYLSLRCSDCKFEMYPSDDFASENEYFKEWNSLNQIDAVIEEQDRQIEFAKKIVDQCVERKAHYNWTKERIRKAREKSSRVQ